MRCVSEAKLTHNSSTRQNLNAKLMQNHSEIANLNTLSRHYSLNGTNLQLMATKKLDTLPYFALLYNDSLACNTHSRLD